MRTNHEVPKVIFKGSWTIALEDREFGPYANGKKQSRRQARAEKAEKQGHRATGSAW